MRPQTGELINGKYRLIRLIGDGGMGSVFEARHEYLGATVALKFLHSELARRPGLVARFLREARLSANIKSPHIVHVTDVDQANDGIAYIVMEMLEGESLMKIVDRERKLSIDVALDYTIQMLSGLEAAHAAGVVHRDLKPDNVFVVKTPQGPLVKLLDFGIAKLRTSKEFQVGLTRPGVMMGTPEYMAPEQAFAADSVDARADIYSIGAMLYEMLAGTRPAHGEDAQQIAAFILSGRVARLNSVNASVPEALANVVHRAMAPDPAERFASAVELRNALLPHARSLSFAGRLAATPPPGEAASRGVAPTWPPDAGPPKTQPDGGTEAAHPPLPAPTAAAPWSPMQTPPAAAPPYPAATYGSSRPPDARVAPTRARGPRRLSIWLLLLMIAAAAAIVAAAMTMSDTTPGPDRPPTVATQAPTSPSPSAAKAGATATPRTTAAPNIAPPVQPPKETAGVAAHPSTKRPADAGPEDAQAKVGTPGIPGLPFPFPAGFPLPSAFPMPSGLPLPLPLPFPSGFPPFQLPGFPQPAPASSQ